jgi:isocitrate/isopropylmalate dehydrogenase
LTHRIAVIPGDGIGPEVVAEAARVLARVGNLQLETLPWSATHYLNSGVTIPPDGYDMLRSFDAVFIGRWGIPASR